MTSWFLPQDKILWLVLKIQAWMDDLIETGKNAQEVYGKAREHKMCRSLANVIQGKHSDKRFGMAVKDD